MSRFPIFWVNTYLCYSIPTGIKALDNGCLLQVLLPGELHSPGHCIHSMAHEHKQARLCRKLRKNDSGRAARRAYIARSNSNLNACPEAADTSRMSATKHEPYRLRTDSAKPRLMDPRSRQPGLKRVHSHRVRLVCRAHMCARAFGDRKWSRPGGMGAGCNVWEIELQATRVQLCAHGISYGDGT